jgi:hypothetical protein
MHQCVKFVLETGLEGSSISDRRIRSSSATATLSITEKKNYPDQSDTRFLSRNWRMTTGRRAGEKRGLVWV